MSSRIRREPHSLFEQRLASGLGQRWLAAAPAIPVDKVDPFNLAHVPTGSLTVVSQAMSNSSVAQIIRQKAGALPVRQISGFVRDVRQ